VFEAENGDQMHDFFENHAINLVIMDINLPGKNGLILAREVRDRKNVGLIFLTGRDNDVDRILGLEIGADDYLTKPFNPRELTIRARNLLSRTTNSSEDDDLPSRVSFNGWTLDGDSRSLISPNGKEFRLPRSEFRALHLFLSNPGKILTREQLIMEMTGRELRPNDRTVDVTIRRIRKHFESDPTDEELIVTIHGEGYRFCGQVDG
jgi:two-component system aerobic respiration control protein ArcA